MQRLKCFQGGRRVFFALSLIFTCSLARSQKLDVLNTNGMSDVWEQVYSASALDPNADSDGDGVSNLKESIAGTDPLNANSSPRVATMQRVGNNFTVTMPLAQGKQYQLQSVQPEVNGWTNWTVEMTLVARTGTVVTLTAPMSANAKFFRVAISDVDTDGDGLSDWEEYQLGLDPFNPSSNNQIDGVGQPMSDYGYAATRITSQNVINISASDPTCIQPDSGSAQDLGQFTITRGGFPLNSINVGLSLGGPGTGYGVSGVDFLPLPPSIALAPGVGSTTVSVRPLAHASLLNPVVAQLKLVPGSGYTLGIASNASVVIYPSQTPTGTGLTGMYYTNSSATYANAANFNPANLKLTRVDTNINFNWGSTNYLPITNSGYYSIRWQGQVQPQYSETYFFNARTDDGVKLWVNDTLIVDSWTAHSASNQIGSITLNGGVRYNLKMEYFNAGVGSALAQLSWWSASQASNAIPTERFYPTNATPAPAVVTSPLVAYGFVNVPFSFTNTADNTPTRFTAAPLPPGLTYTNNGTNGVFGGTPSLAGTFPVMVTASNTVGVSASILTMTIFDTGNSVVREVWTNVPGIKVADIPVASPPSSSAPFGTLEGITNFGDNYGERIRGFITIPTTGNYYFWIAGSDSAELWISNDKEPANKVRRAYVSPTANPAPPPANGTAPQQWNLQPNQKSSWLAMQAGQRYYIEILHKADAGAGDNWAVGWLLDLTGTNTTPSGIVPGYLLSPYYPPAPSVAAGTLYVANMVAGPGVTNMPVGSATLRLSADNSKAVLNFSMNGISSTITGEHIDSEAYLASPPATIMFDISDSFPQPDGSYLWTIGPVGTLSATDVLNVLNEGKAYITILTLNYPDGELIGHFAPVQGSPTFTPPAAPPAWTDDHTSTNAASRFLAQATFGPSLTDITNVQAVGYTNWIDNQFALPVSPFLPQVYAKINPDLTTPYPQNTLYNIWWETAVNAPDQLRQRVAFALSEIMVVSSDGVLSDNGRSLGDYYDTLLDHSFGNFRELLEAVSLSSAMGLYLNMQGNDKGNIMLGTHANENYAREIMQLFSVGLNRMWPDGSLVLDSSGSLVPTYDQNVILGVAADFTGWNYWQPNQGNGRLPTSFSPSANYTNPMVLVPTHHDLNTKLLLDNVVLPAAQGSQANSSSTNFDNYCLQDLELALDNIFNNQNVGPFICRQLIQRLVTSHPRPAYLYRVVQTFNDNGAGVRGDMQAVIKAILLDYEARSPVAAAATNFGKQREPLLRVTAMARAFPGPAPLSGTYSQPNATTVNITLSGVHRATNGENVLLSFTDGSGQPAPASQVYAVSAAGATTFNVTAPGVTSGTYTQALAITLTNVVGGVTNVFTSDVIMVTNNGHGLSLSNWVYLSFVTGGALSGQYQVIWTPNANVFAVGAPESTPRSGAVWIPKLTGGSYTVTRGTNVAMSTAYPHGLSLGNSVYVNFTQAGSPADGLYQVSGVTDATHFSFIVATTGNTTQNGMTIYPLVAPPIPRSGTVQATSSTWQLNSTDTGATYNLAQTPLNAPTVFNFFYPDYKFPGALAAAGVTTPEFQLTADTSVALQMNFLESGILSTANNNTNGISSFINNAGAITLDISPWMTPGYTSNAGIPSLVDALSSILCGGPLSGNTRTTIINYVANNTNFPYTTPTGVQMRDRVRAVIHLISNSPDYTIQR